MIPDAGTELKRALRKQLVQFGGAIGTEDLVSRPWAGIAFSGERHGLTLHIAGDGAAAAADAFLDGLTEREFELRGHILADIVLVEDRREGDAVRLRLEALTVEAD